MKKKSGFSLAELIVAMGLLTIATLSILGLSILVSKSSQESDDRVVAKVAAGNLLNRVVDQVRTDSPAGVAANFWDNEHSNPAWDEGTYTNDGTEFRYRILASSVLSSSGGSVGGTTANNRLKKVDVTVWWWGSDTQSRQGYGDLRFELTRLVSEGETL